jgi:uncharacterized membrane protein YeaQ/YmgE (transglycosylase-associated protein family)
MALLVLILLGSTLGWLASIIARTEATRDILRQMGAGTLAALVGGLIVNQGSIIGGLSFLALGAAIVVCTIALFAYHGLARRNSDSTNEAEAEA